MRLSCLGEIVTYERFIPKGSTLGLAGRELWLRTGLRTLSASGIPLYVPLWQANTMGVRGGAGGACGENLETKTLFFFFPPYWEDPRSHLAS